MHSTALGWFSLAALITAGSLTGCLTPFRAPADVAHLRLEKRDSPTLCVDKVWLERRDGTLFVTGYVIPELGIRDTMRSHIVVTLVDANGAELRSMPVDFQPRQIPVRTRGPKAVGRYSCILDSLPPETAVVRVAALDNRPE